MQDSVNDLTVNPLAATPQRMRRTVGHRAVVGRDDCQNTEPQITVQKSEGRVQSIMVTCSCGQKIVIDCDYS